MDARLQVSWVFKTNSVSQAVKEQNLEPSKVKVSVTRFAGCP